MNKAVNSSGLGLFRATGIYVGAILGSGVLVLPAIAAQVAGPASILAWGLLLVFCTPVAFSFAEMSRQQPDAGGIATFVTRAFGHRASAVAGYLFYFAIPFGAPATAVIGGEYIAHAMGGGRETALIAAGLILAAGFLSNAVGIRVSSKLQLLLMALLVALLAFAVVVAGPYARVENFEPFAPHGYWAVGGAASLLFFCFAGWEAVTHLAGEFRNPERDLKRATWLTLVVVGVVYIGLVAACVAVLGPALAGSSVPVAELLAKGLGPAAAPVTAVAAAVLTFGPLNTFVAGASKLGARLASDGVLPRALARGAGPGEVPSVSLGVLGMLASISFALAATGLLSMEFQIGAASACFTAVTAFGLAAGVVLLRRGTPAWYGVIVAAVVMLVVLVFSGWALLVPAGLGVAALAAWRVRGKPATSHGSFPASPQPSRELAARNGRPS
ncbi:amino acid permease [Paenarthrobacter nitroguajacolicus]|uniref:APC family permease n=1 Tax=Paenarthrobacter nitroguajacolicus TaxID=211146 RepID=UPI00285CA4EE|nr:amino acid permease [Paenarthrobacter nitroguajacolicus]MDR6638899.1 amino acid efflux transporter [Paenarthrobacter nitroguajacolicus]